MHHGHEDARGQCQLPFILAVNPDPLEARALRNALSEHVKADVLLVASKEEAFTAIDKRIPELILLHAFMPPDDEEHFIAYLSKVPGAEYVQVISIPQLLRSTDCDQRQGLLLGGFRRRRSKVIQIACDPHLFAADVTEYLALARVIATEIERREADDRHASERRGGCRWSPSDVPWVSSVRLVAGELADLVNVSSTGTLIRTHIRPVLASLKRVDLDHRPPSGLTFHLATGEQVRATGQVVRCRPRPMGTRHILYEVAFRFDQSSGLDLPDAALFAVGTAAGAQHIHGNEESLQAQSHRVRDLFDREAASQNELQAGQVSKHALPTNVPDAVKELIGIKAALLGIRTTMQGARGATLLDLARIHGARVRELDVMRKKLVERISHGDRLPIPAQLS